MPDLFDACSTKVPAQPRGGSARVSAIRAILIGAEVDAPGEEVPQCLPALVLTTATLCLSALVLTTATLWERLCRGEALGLRRSDGAASPLARE